jgi:predicted DNA-binding ribbon-helix-helix protein
MTDTSPTTVNRTLRRLPNTAYRPREYLTEAEVDRLIETARKRGRNGARDAAAILLAYRHGLRAQELCSLRWSQIDLRHGRLHVNRAKGGIETSPLAVLLLQQVQTISPLPGLRLEAGLPRKALPLASGSDYRSVTVNKTLVSKRSIVIANHKTSVSLEDKFWDSLKEIAVERGMTLGALVAAIDAGREHGNLSSAIRLFVLGVYLISIAEASGGTCCPKEWCLRSDHRQNVQVPVVTLRMILTNPAERNGGHCQT